LLDASPDNPCQAVLEQKEILMLTRRNALRLAASTVAMPFVSTTGWAQAYPTRPVRIFVGYAAGGPTDIVARLIGQWLSERLGQQFIVENRPGGSGNIAAETVVRAPPDGYTLLTIGPSNAINATLYDNLTFNFARDIAPAAGIMRVSNVMEVNATFPAKTVTEFISYGKANPGKINFASAGVGTSIHLAAELFKMMTAVNMVHVPYRGEAPALTDLIGGQVQVLFGTTPGSIEHIRTGKLRALAVTTAIRSSALPDVPTMAEFLPGFEASSWYGIGAPKNTPAGIIEKLNLEINAALADPRMQARLADLGGTLISGSPGDFGNLIAEETAKWGKVVRFAALKPE
jgi:tripartite-type tricarboxylate transporter receptor subunit TctC